MKHALLWLLLAGGPAWQLLTWVRERNANVAAGRAAYARGDGAGAARRFSTALMARPGAAPDAYLLLNLGHAQVRAGQVAAATATYSRLLPASPPTLGSVARQQLAVLASEQGHVAQALSLLRQALLLDPANRDARFDFERLTDYVARQTTTPQIPAPPKEREPKPATPDSKKNAGRTQPAEKAGADRAGQASDPQAAPTSPNAPQERRPDANGRPDSQQPPPPSGKGEAGGRRPADGPPGQLPSGEAPGQQRGLTNSEATTQARNQGGRTGGSASATAADQRLQTQRERLRALNLTPAQARQLLETMRAQEAQYLQQLPPLPAKKPDPNLPTW